MNASEENDDELGKLDGVFDNIESVFDSGVFGLVSIVEFEKVLEDLDVVEDAVVSEEVHEVLVVDTEFLFFVFLLVFENKIVEEDFIESVDVLLN